MKSVPAHCNHNEIGEVVCDDKDDDGRAALNIEGSSAAVKKSPSFHRRGSTKGGDHYVRIDESAAAQKSSEEPGTKKSWLFFLGWFFSLGWLRGGGVPSRGSATTKRGFSFLMFWRKKGEVGAELPITSTRDNSTAEMRALKEKYYTLIFATLTMIMVTLIDTLGDPFSGQPDKVQVTVGDAFIIFLPSIFWFECFLVCSCISIRVVMFMKPGFKKYFMVALCFGLAYGIISWFAKAYAFKVLVGSTEMNGALFCGAYLIAVSVSVWPFIIWILKTRA